MTNEDEALSTAQAPADAAAEEDALIADDNVASPTVQSSGDAIANEDELFNNDVITPLTVQTSIDDATDENNLFYNSFIKGVSGFIKTCPTPMAISIQGDWGAGKTSLINQVETELQAKTESTDGDDQDERKYCKGIINVAIIDVWQQSVTNPKADLFKNLLREVVEKLSGNKLEAMEKVSEFASVASQIVGALMVAGDDDEDEGDSKKNSEGEDVAFAFLLDSDDDSKSKSESDSEKDIDVNTLQSFFYEALREASEEYGKSEDARFVVFIDGLDHINPEAAVDLMEQIKNHLDCSQCVFVYAVDEKIVYEGIKKKLGDKVDEGRKRKLFERFVQVPLRIPANAYNLNKLIKDLLRDKPELAGEFVEVIDTLANDPTPRNIERYVNATNLYRSVFGGSEGVEDSSLSMLFAAVILEVESAQGFDAVADCARGDEAHFAENLKAKLGSLNLGDGINWTMLPALWHGGEGVDGDAAKRSAFLFWVLKLR